MNKVIIHSTIAALILLVGVAPAEPLTAELVMGEGRTWQGQIIRRDGDWIEFSTGTAAQPIRIGIASIKELNFKVDVSSQKIAEMIQNLEYEQVITSLTKALEPFAEYSDVPSNLTRYNILLMEMYYRAGKYDQCLTLSEEISRDDRNPALQAQARVYRALALIDSEKVQEAKALLVEFGWDREAPPDASPQELYIRAKLRVLNGEPVQAIELVARVIAFHSDNPDWIQPAELLCAEIYTDLGMYDSAEEVCRQILILYKSTPEYDKAMRLKVRIDELRAQS